MKDALNILEWRNEPHARAMFRSSESVDPAAHLVWYSRALESNHKRIFIGEACGKPVGMVRFDKTGLAWEVSINVASAFRGKGYGRQLLRLGIETFRERPLLAHIKIENAASLRIFEACGFLFEAEPCDGYMQGRLGAA